MLSKHVAWGAGVRFMQASQRDTQGIDRIDVLLDTDSKVINGIQGSFSYDARSVSIHAIDDSNSIVSVWVERPHQTQDVGELSFSGVMPGGYEGKQGKLFTILISSRNLVASGMEKSALRMASGLVFLNDGLGTSIAYGSSSIALSLHSASKGEALYSNDVTPPESFIPILTHDPLFFDNKMVVVFSAVDKDSGIARYEVAETPAGADNFLWHEEESPYLLKDQNLASDIYVRAVDNAGNVRIVKAVSQTQASGVYTNTTIIIFISILLLLCAGWIIKHIRKK